MLKSSLIGIMLAFLGLRADAQVNKTDSLFKADAKIISGKGGGATMLIMKDDAVLYNNSYGSFNADKQVLIASASKWYSAAVIMILFDEGKLSLDDKVSKYIPSFKGDKANITIRQCFSHTSGLPAEKHGMDELMSKSTGTYSQMVDDIAAMDLVAKPGAEFNYGGLSMQVAGRVAEIVSGKDWNTLFKEKLTGPLGMGDTHFAGYRLGRVPRLAGGALSTANDYLKFLQMIAHKGMYKGKRMLSENAVNLMLADETMNAAIGYSPFSKYKKLNPGTPQPRYGMGNWLIKGWGNAVVNSSPGLFGFTPWIDMESGTVGVISVFSHGPAVMPFFRKVLMSLKK